MDVGDRKGQRASHEEEGETKKHEKMKEQAPERTGTRCGDVRQVRNTDNRIKHLEARSALSLCNKVKVNAI